MLQIVEERRLEAEGENLVTARRKAQRAAEAMVAMAAELRSDKSRKHAIARAMLHAAEKPEAVLVTREHGLIWSRTRGILDTMLGSNSRFLAGVVLLLGCLLWMHQNGMISGSEIKEAAQKAIESRDLQVMEEAAEQLDSRIEGATETQPLSLPLLPTSISRMFNSFTSGVAGLILLFSSVFSGARMSLFAAPAAFIALAGPGLSLPVVGLLSPLLAMLGGAALLFLGILFGRSRP